MTSDRTAGIDPRRSGRHRRGRLQRRSTPTPPSPPPVAGPPREPPSAATIVIRSSNTFMPLEVTVAVGGRVSFETGTTGRSTSCRTRHWFTPTVHRSRR